MSPARVSDSLTGSARASMTGMMQAIGVSELDYGTALDQAVVSPVSKPSAKNRSAKRSK